MHSNSTKNISNTKKSSQYNIPFINNNSQITFNPNQTHKLNYKDKEPYQNNSNAANSNIIFNSNVFNGTNILNTGGNTNIQGIYNSNSLPEFNKLGMIKKDEELIKLESKRLNTKGNLMNKGLKSVDEVKYPETAKINRIEYNSNYDSNAIDNLDIVKYQQEKSYSQYLEKKKRKNEGASFNEDNSNDNKTGSVKGKYKI